MDGIASPFCSRLVARPVCRQMRGRQAGKSKSLPRKSFGIATRVSHSAGSVLKLDVDVFSAAKNGEAKLWTSPQSPTAGYAKNLLLVQFHTVSDVDVF